MSNELLVSTRKGLFVLKRKGAQWAIDSVSFLGEPVSLSLFDPRDKTIYVGLFLGHFGAKFHRSRDMGKTWSELPAPAFPKEPDGTKDVLPDGRPWPWKVLQIWELVAGGKEQELWAGTIGGGLFHSTNGGETWDLVRSMWDHPDRKKFFGGGAEVPGIHSVLVHPNDPNDLRVGISIGGVWRSKDAGMTWDYDIKGMFAEYMPPEKREESIAQDVHRLARCASHPDRVWAQHHNGAFRSDDGGVTWESITIPPSSFGFAVAAHPTDKDTAWFVPAKKDQYRVPVDAKVVVAKTTDGGKTFSQKTKGLPQEHAYDLVFRHALDVDDDGDTLAFGSTTGSLWTSADGGESWQTVSTHLPPVYAVRFAR
jgi:hypothetical protein